MWFGSANAQEIHIETVSIESTINNTFVRTPTLQPLAVKKLDVVVRDGVDQELYTHAKEVSDKEWGEDYFEYFDSIIMQESGWRVFTAHYPTGYTKGGVKSSAHGLGGFIDATWETVDCEKTDDPFIQVECTARYITDRYENPEKAWAFHLEANHY